MFISFDNNLVVRHISDIELFANGQTCRKADNKYNWESLLGKRIPKSMLLKSDFKHKPVNEIRVAMICNWKDQCGISTYSDYLAHALQDKVARLKVFSETSSRIPPSEKFEIEDCWTRGESLLDLADRILDWEPDLVITQHEFGIFPNAFFYMQLMQHLKKIPNVTAMHSIYRHTDKLIYTESIPNIVVHTEEAKQLLEDLGNSSKVFVVPHGCTQSEKSDEIWNIMHNPYTVMQFGFGFRYKGVDRALHALSHLVHSDPKFKNIYYFYLCSSNSHNEISNQEYCDYLMDLAKKLDIRRNVAIITKYQSDKMLNLYLRLAKIVIFPYLVNDDNMVYGSSGAVRLAMSSKRPVIASESHLFDDIEGIVPRPADHLSLAKEIDEIFSNSAYKNTLVEKSSQFVLDNSWESVADKYLALYNELVNK